MTQKEPNEMLIKAQAALDFDLPPREVAPLGRALVNAWEVIHPLRGDE